MNIIEIIILFISVDVILKAATYLFLCNQYIYMLRTYDDFIDRQFEKIDLREVSNVKSIFTYIYKY